MTFAIGLIQRPEYEAKFSLQHCVAISLLDGENVFASYTHRRVTGPTACDPASQSPQERVTALPIPRIGVWEVTVHLRDGGEITATRNARKGDPELPLDREQMIDIPENYWLSHR